MGISERLRSLLRRNKAVRGPTVPGVKERSVDTALIIEAARLVVTTRLATKTLLMRQLYVTGGVAEQLMAKLIHCEVITAAGPVSTHRVITTSGQLPGLIAEIERRGRLEREGNELD